MSNPPILVTDRIKQVLQDHGVTREMIERRVAEHRPRGRRLSVDLNALTFQRGVVAAMRNEYAHIPSLGAFPPTHWHIPPDMSGRNLSHPARLA